ncbi:uncharacterized protein LOC122060944 [Macadamia integrifolia]|uniref:uncharacterized protein LOC122060944 n=1 Tax=Macadamia integrifolia TaxID=60698 RepID=UPI001C52BB62|nr:uncharacterized protein LOC122060944 [Macadamia integrifolia]
MASLTPGVLLKLLQHASDRNAKVTGEHRSALLQVLEIIPALASGDDPWKSTGFFLKVSDSLHSAYVSISDEDLDLIFSDKIQLGQFLYVSRLDPASPVHVLRGVKPVPKRRPCVGNPTELVSSDLLSIRANVDFSAGFQGSEKVRKSPNVDFSARSQSADKVRKSPNVDFSARSQSAEKVRNSAKKDGLKKTKVRRSSEVGYNSKSRQDSLGSNAKVEDLELARLSLDSMRRGWDQSPGSKNANGVRSLSNLKPKDSTSFSDTASVLSDKKASSSSKSVLKHRSLNNSPPPDEYNRLTLKIPRGPLKRDLKSKEGNSPSSLIKVPVSSKSLSDQDILWESLPSGMHSLGKDTLRCRNAAFVAAADALQEASAVECVIRCMSMFSELCEPNLQDSPGLLVERFLDLHQNIQQASTVVHALLATKSPEGKTSSSGGQLAVTEACKNSTTVKAVDATSWVQAALDTDLSKFSVFVKQDRKETPQNEKRYYIVLENSNSAPTKDVKQKSPSPQNKQSPKIQGSFSDLSTKKVPSRRRVVVPGAKKTNVEKGKWSQGSGLKETASLAKQLLLLSRGWFLKYLEDSLSSGFGLKRGEGDDGITVLLGQLKRVNQWLEDAVGDDIEVNERTENLKKKLYGFLLEHVDACVLPSR